MNLTPTFYDCIVSGKISEPDWIDAFPTFTPTHIQIANQPLSKNPDIQKIFLQDYISQLTHQYQKKFSWSEGLLIPNQIKHIYEKLFSSFSTSISAEEKLLDHYFQNNFSNLVICRINSAVGYGVFTLDAIPKGTVVTTYAGKLFSDLDTTNLSHAKYTFYLPANCLVNYGIDEFKNFFANQSSFTSKRFTQIAAEDCGNIGRFIQSFPTEEEMQEDIFIQQNKLEKIVSTSNLEDKFTLYKGWPVIYLEATRDIQPGEQLGYSYGALYWKYMQETHGFKQAFFTREGNVCFQSE